MAAKANVLERGFVKATPQNLPYLSVLSIVHFIENSEKHVAAEIRNTKLNRSTREDYGDDAIGYVQVQSQPGRCVVKGRVTPEHRVNTPPYAVTVIIDTADDMIEEARCHGCQARNGGCKHVAAFLFWLHRRSAEKAVTEVSCYWTKPRLSNVSNLSPMKGSDLGKRRQVADVSESDDFVDRVLEEVEKGNHKPQGVFFEMFAQKDQSAVNPLAATMSTICKDCPTSGMIAAREFLSTKVDAKLSAAVRHETRGQADSPVWHHARHGRVTASKLLEVARCSKTSGSLVEGILGYRKFRGTIATRRGLALEPQVLSVVEEMLGVEIWPTGLHIIPKRPMFAASPDGMCMLDGTFCAVEVKCPTAAHTLNNYVDENEEIATKVRAQMQLQMLAIGAKMGLLCVADPGFEESAGVRIYRDKLDLDFLGPIMEKAESFWFRAILPVFV